MTYISAPLPNLSLLWGRDARENTPLHERFSAVFEKIRKQALQAELNRELPFEQIRLLKESGFTALRVPVAHGGLGASLEDLFSLITALAKADSNVAQALRAHFGFVEHLLFEPDGPYRTKWLDRLGAGQTAGAAAAEGPASKRDLFSTTLSQKDGHWVINGSKFFTTGSLYADWLTVTGTTEDGQTVKTLAARNDPGLEIVDDWDGVGQRLTASGTAHFRDVHTEDADLRYGNTAFPYSQAFFQLYHLATVAGIARSAATDVADAVRRRKRTFSHGNADLPAEDPQILEVVGHVFSGAYIAGAVVERAARAIQAVADSPASEIDLTIARAELEVWQVQDRILPLVLEATTALFDALSGGATLRVVGLDRHWRNVRTLGNHNPRVYRTRVVGDYAVNGTLPPAQWRVGVA
ncbi:acyl-CoA dehydrogenase family protein [Gluconobacter cerinus]|uniref:acyl-CoA dehydrogenase family protein n=1 Tax=Gluconobacter cerinus TaxID=38307 RepID=UPI001B8B4AD7|nr:acyl-CoA dehydrogenase family protein [Gluconobacter cerinus]MBS1032004.1 acyl-CoA dehydrogenase family protein [Gluconobacter cerinus]